VLLQRAQFGIYILDHFFLETMDGVQRYKEEQTELLQALDTVEGHDRGPGINFRGRVKPRITDHINRNVPQGKGGKKRQRGRPLGGNKRRRAHRWRRREAPVHHGRDYRDRPIEEVTNAALKKHPLVSNHGHVKRNGDDPKDGTITVGKHYRVQCSTSPDSTKLGEATSADSNLPVLVSDNRHAQRIREDPKDAVKVEPADANVTNGLEAKACVRKVASPQCDSHYRQRTAKERKETATSVENNNRLQRHTDSQIIIVETVEECTADDKEQQYLRVRSLDGSTNKGTPDGQNLVLCCFPCFPVLMRRWRKV
jgi:hypothetical protein